MAVFGCLGFRSRALMIWLGAGRVTGRCLSFLLARDELIASVFACSGAAGEFAEAVSASLEVHRAASVALTGTL